MFPGRGAVVASIAEGNGCPFGAASATDLGVEGVAKPVTDGGLLILPKKLFTPAGTSNGLGGGLSGPSGALSNPVRSVGGGSFRLGAALVS